MYTTESIQEFAKVYGFKPSQTKRELKELASLLHPDETVHGLLEGTLGRIHGRDVTGNGLVIATNRRLIFFRKSIIGTVTKEETHISKVSAASYRKGLLTSSIAITTANNESVVGDCEKAMAKKFIDVVQNLINESDRPAAVVSSAPNHLEQLEKLFEMKEKGILTEDEYTSQKAKLLA